MVVLVQGPPKVGPKCSAIPNTPWLIVHAAFAGKSFYTVTSTILSFTSARCNAVHIGCRCSILYSTFSELPLAQQSHNEKIPLSICWGSRACTVPANTTTQSSCAHGLRQEVPWYGWHIAMGSVPRPLNSAGVLFGLESVDFSLNGWRATSILFTPRAERA